MIIQTSTSADRHHPFRVPHSNVRATVVRGAFAMVIAGVALFSALSLPACRTTEGLGRDVEALGDNVADSADKHKP